MQNGTTTTADRFEALSANLNSVVEYLTSHPPKGSSAPEAVAKPSVFARAGTLIKDHPIAAIGIAFGVGYLVMRMVRR